jgi:hypothetical protein
MRIDDPLIFKNPIKQSVLDRIWIGAEGISADQDSDTSEQGNFPKRESDKVR